MTDQPTLTEAYATAVPLARTIARIDDRWGGLPSRTARRDRPTPPYRP